MSKRKQMKRKQRAKQRREKVARRKHNRRGSKHDPMLEAYRDTRLMGQLAVAAYLIGD